MVTLNRTLSWLSPLSTCLGYYLRQINILMISIHGAKLFYLCILDKLIC